MVVQQEPKVINSQGLGTHILKPWVFYHLLQLPSSPVVLATPKF